MVSGPLVMPAAPAAERMVSGPLVMPAAPAAERMRPQLGSPPKKAHLTSGELAIARAAARASSAVAAPVTRTAMTFVPPSASSAIW